MAAVRAGRSVIYDVTNINPKLRRLTIRELRENGIRWIIGYWLDVPLPICQERNRERERVVPERSSDACWSSCTDPLPPFTTDSMSW